MICSYTVRKNLNNEKIIINYKLTKRKEVKEYLLLYSLKKKSNKILLITTLVNSKRPKL